MVNSKEIQNSVSGNEQAGSVEMRDLRKEADGALSGGVENWMEKLEEGEGDDQKTVTDNSGQTILTSANSNNPVIVLPITKATFATGLKKTMSEAGRWLSVFVERIIKKNKGQVRFKDDDNRKLN